MLKNKLVQFTRVALLLAVVSGAALAANTAHAADTVKMAEDGKPLATIELAPQASLALRSVALEMADYLERIVGAPFEITQTPGTGPRILLGQTAEFPAYKAADALRGRGEEAFLMRTAGDRVLLLGATEHGAKHAAYAFLEELGVRWFFPTETWEVVPETHTLTANLDEVQSPDMQLHRNLWYGNMGGYFDATHMRLDWMRHNRMKPDGPAQSHTRLGLDREKDFAEHPEWFALVDGKRHNSKPNYGHPEVAKRAVAWALKQAEAGAKSISVSAPDGLNFCECDLCLQVAGIERDTVHKINGAIFGKRPDGTLVCVTSETIFRMANIVAEAVTQKYPDVLISVYAYSGYAHPPSFDLHPKVYVAVASGYRRTPLSYEDQIKIFGTKTKQMGVYDYYLIAKWYNHKPGHGLKMSHLRERMPFYHANNVQGVNAEASNNWGAGGLDYYIASKLMWDAQSDVDALYADFLDKAFGAAQVPMKSYYDRWEAKTELSLVSVSAALDDLLLAYRLADTAAAKKRVGELYLYNRFLRLGEEIKELKDKPEQAALIGNEYAGLFWRLQDTMLMQDKLTPSKNRPLVPAFTVQEVEAMMAEDAA